MMDGQEEKRTISRVDYHARGEIAYGDALFPGEIVNFSLNGLLFRTDEPIDIPEQEKVTVNFAWDGGEMEAVSTIGCLMVRKDGHTLGLKFDMIDYDTLMGLKERLAAKMGDKIDEEFISFLTE